MNSAEPSGSLSLRLDITFPHRCVLTVTEYLPSFAQTSFPTMADTTTTDAAAEAPFALPRVTIKFCTQCKWNLRAAYVRALITTSLVLSRPQANHHPPPPQFAQELLSTFSTSLGEVALQPSTGGTFVVEIFHSASSPPAPSSIPSPPPIPSYPHIASTILWDRKTDGGFPETKELKRRVRDVIEPGRNLGHVDRDHAKPGAAAAAASSSTPDVNSAKAGADEGLPSRKDVETAVGTAGDGGPGSSEAAAVLVGDLQGGNKKEPCEDC